MKEGGRVCHPTFCVSCFVVLCLVFVFCLLHKPHGDSGQLVGAKCPTAPRSGGGSGVPPVTERAQASEGDERGGFAPERVPCVMIGYGVPNRLLLSSLSTH